MKLKSDDKMKKHSTVWLASLATSQDGVTTRAFSTEAKAWAWKEEWANNYRGGEPEDPRAPSSTKTVIAGLISASRMCASTLTTSSTKVENNKGASAAQPGRKILGA